MQLPGEATVKLVVDVLAVAVVIGIVYYFGSGLISGIQAPAKLDAALGNNAALAAGVKGQNEAIDGLKKKGDARKAKSQKAVEAAGKKELEEAARIMATPAAGETPLERAANRINAEFGR